MDLGLSCNWIFPTGVQSVETKLSYIQLSVKKKKDKLESRHPAALFADYPDLWPLIKKGPALNWTLWEFLWHVFPSESCLGNPLEGLAEVYPFPREPISSGTQAVGASSGGVCELVPPLGPSASTNYLYVKLPRVLYKVLLWQTHIRIPGSSHIPYAGSWWKYCQAMGPVASKHLGVRTKRSYILVLLLYLLKWVHDSRCVS